MSDDVILARIHRGLERDGYYVDPALRDEVSETQLAQLREDLAAADETTYVVAFPLSPTDAFRGNAADLLTRLVDAYPEPGLYLSTTADRGLDDAAPIRFEARDYGPLDGISSPDSSLVSFDLNRVLESEQADELGEALLRSVELLELDDQDLRELAQEARDRELGTGPLGSGDEALEGGSGALLLAGVLVCAVLLTWALRRLGKKPAVDIYSTRLATEASTVPLGTRIAIRLSPPRETDRPDAGAALVLPAATLARIRDAHERELAEQARDAVLELGVSIDRVSLTTKAERAGWQVAVDHYQAARDILERFEGGGHDPDVLDVVGAQVLTRRAQDALLAARRGRRWKPQSPCFLHPLHPRPVGRMPVGPLGEEVAVCRDCRNDLQADRRPDVLEVPRSGRLEPYYETGAEPWVSTGYGALVPDLLGAVRAHDAR